MTLSYFSRTCFSAAVGGRKLAKDRSKDEKIKTEDRESRRRRMRGILAPRQLNSAGHESIGQAVCEKARIKSTSNGRNRMMPLAVNTTSLNGSAFRISSSTK